MNIASRSATARVDLGAADRLDRPAGLESSTNQATKRRSDGRPHTDQGRHRDHRRSRARRFPDRRRPCRGRQDRRGRARSRRPGQRSSTRWTASSCPGSSTRTATRGRRSSGTSRPTGRSPTTSGSPRHDQSLYRPEDTYSESLIRTLEALDSGITTLLDWSHNLNTPEHSDAAVDALFESGARVVFAHGGGHQHWQPISSLDHPAEDVRRLRDARFSSNDQLVTMALAPRGNQFATMEVTERDWALAKELDLRITCHFGDGEWGKGRPIAQLAENQLLGPTMTFVHCNTLADDELQMMADHGVSASISPDIELQMGHGWPATGRLLDVGIRPSLSIDVCCSNGGHLFGTMRATIGIGADSTSTREAREGVCRRDAAHLSRRARVRHDPGCARLRARGQDRQPDPGEAGRRDPRSHRQLRHDTAQQPDRAVRLQRPPGPRRHDPRRRQGRQARRQAPRHRRRPRAPARGRVPRRHHASCRRQGRCSHRRRLDPEGVRGGWRSTTPEPPRRQRAGSTACAPGPKKAVPARRRSARGCAKSATASGSACASSPAGSTSRRASSRRSRPARRSPPFARCTRSSASSASRWTRCSRRPAAPSATSPRSPS